MDARALARDLLPPAVLRGMRVLRGRSPVDIESVRPMCRTAGSWPEAVRASTGYDARDILRRVESATRQVLAGESAFERDAVAFARFEYSYPVLAGLLRAAAQTEGPLAVLDFGGSLGSSYRQYRSFLSVVPRIHWMVVEQAHFVAAGQERYTTEELSFHSTIEEAAATHRPHVALAASSLQYLEDPYATLARLGSSGANTLLIDRTPWIDGEADRLIVQEVPPAIYPASYPCWLLGRARLLEAAGPGWRLLGEYVCADAPLRTDHGDVLWRGGILVQSPADPAQQLLGKIGAAGNPT